MIGKPSLSAGDVTTAEGSASDEADAARGQGEAEAEPAIQLGVYVHVPFCRSRCDYCAFATWTDRQHLVGDYLDALRRDIERAFNSERRRVVTVFIGGGTPSLVPAAGLAAVLAEIPLAAGAEVTVECNPDDVTEELLAVYRAAGVSRISLGVQSMVPRILGLLGRQHDPANVIGAVDAIRQVGFDSFNVDLIYGCAGERLDEWTTTLQSALELEPPHVSAYALTVEAGTPLAADPARHPDDDVQAEEYELADELLTAAGLANYEISNWSQPGHACRHNLLYWRQHDYLGFGCAAHSHLAGRRWWNVRTPDRYIAAVAGGQPTEAAGETLDAETRRLEGLQLALRTTSGVPRDALDGDSLGDLVEPRDDRWVLTRHGRLLANEVAIRLR
jgi:putative oxygen-independent coproporphyrinogen III oxidase